MVVPQVYGIKWKRVRRFPHRRVVFTLTKLKFRKKAKSANACALSDNGRGANMGKVTLGKRTPMPSPIGIWTPIQVDGDELALNNVSKPRPTAMRIQPITF